MASEESNSPLLFRLPRELRDQIYRILVVRRTRFHRPHRFEPPQNRLNINVLLLNKAIHDEASDIFYCENSFLSSHMFTTQAVHASLWPTRITPFSNAQLSLIRDITFRVHASWDENSFVQLYMLWKDRVDVKRLIVEVHLPNLTGVHLVCTQQAAPIRTQLSALFKLRNIMNVKLEIHWVGWWNARDLDEVLRDLESMARLMGSNTDTAPSSSSSPPHDQSSPFPPVSVSSKHSPITASAYAPPPSVAFPLERMSPTKVSAEWDADDVVHRFLDELNWRRDYKERAP